jgi:peptidoglycan hydrolase-like protein with peptidoglycan-binding domain
MVFSLTWLPEVLEDAGLKVAEHPGWRTRGRGDVGKIRGVICHHTAGASKAHGVMPTLNTLVNGRAATATTKALSGPLSQLGLARDGTWIVIAAGRANHAGDGNWRGVTTGNSSMIGVEAENTGLPNDSPWPEVQMDAYARGVAAILKKIGAGADMCCGHKEYALPKGRKLDPSFEMDPFRDRVAEILGGTAVTRPLIPAVDANLRPTLRRGAQGDVVKQMQRKLKLADDGVFGPATEAAVRAFQRKLGLVPDGIVGPRSWLELDTL